MNMCHNDEVKLKFGQVFAHWTIVDAEIATENFAIWSDIYHFETIKGPLSQIASHQPTGSGIDSLTDKGH